MKPLQLHLMLEVPPAGFVTSIDKWRGKSLSYAFRGETSITMANMRPAISWALPSDSIKWTRFSLHDRDALHQMMPHIWIYSNWSLAKIKGEMINTDDRERRKPRGNEKPSEPSTLQVSAFRQLHTCFFFSSPSTWSPYYLIPTQNW